MDALFGLPRKKSAGKSVKEPVHGHLFFKEQQSVDEFVESATSRRASLNVYYHIMYNFHSSMITSPS